MRWPNPVGLLSSWLEHIALPMTKYQLKMSLFARKIFLLSQIVLR